MSAINTDSPPKGGTSPAVKPPSPALYSLCLQRLCDCPMTASQLGKMRDAGLLYEDTNALTQAGFVLAYTQLAEIRWGGSNKARFTIADAAREEAELWKTEIVRRGENP